MIPLHVLRSAFAVGALLLGTTAVFAQTPAHTMGTMAPAAPTATVTLGALELSGAFSRATLPNAPVGGGFLTITNTGTESDRLIAATSPIAKVTQLHQMAVVNDIMKMGELENGVEIAPGASVTLTPGGTHIMFMGLTQRLTQGETAPVTLTFEKAGTVTLDFAIEGVSASGATPAHGS